MMDQELSTGGENLGKAISRNTHWFVAEKQSVFAPESELVAAQKPVQCSDKAPDVSAIGRTCESCATTLKPRQRKLCKSCAHRRRLERVKLWKQRQKALVSAQCRACGEAFRPHQRGQNVCRDPECRLVYRRWLKRRSRRLAIRRAFGDAVMTWGQIAATLGITSREVRAEFRSAIRKLHESPNAREVFREMTA